MKKPKILIDPYEKNLGHILYIYYTHIITHILGSFLYAFEQMDTTV